MKLKIIHSGYGKRMEGSDFVQEYTNRIKHYCPIENEYINLTSVKKLTFEQCKKQESAIISDKIKSEDYLILLDERGKEFTSMQLAKRMNFLQNQIRSTVVICIGGSYGFDDTMKSKAKEIWSLSKLTLPHQLVRFVILEQLYRAFTILNNESYHHD